MHTFPKALGALRRIVDQRGAQLREMDFPELKVLPMLPPESIVVESRPATIATIVQSLPDGSLRVIVQGSMKARFLGSHVALDGFHKHPDGKVTSMPDEESCDFD